MTNRTVDLTERARQLRRDSTPSERTLWQALRGGGLGVKFYRQRVTGPFIPDFVCPAHGLVVEVDGAVHESDEVAGRDTARDDWFRACDYEVLRVTAADVEQRLECVTARIRRAIGARPARWKKPAPK